MKTGILTALFVCIIVSPCFAGESINMQPGKWEITTTVNMPNMPVTVPPQTRTQCLTKDDLVPRDVQKGGECRVTSQKVSGNTVTWTMDCNSGGTKTTGSGKITYSGTTFSGEFSMTMGQTGMKMTSTMKGKRIGNCAR